MKGGGMRLSDHGCLLLLSNSSLCGFVRQKHCEEYSLIVSLAPLLGLSNTPRCRFILGEWFVSLSFSICLHCRLAKEKCRKGIVLNFSPSVWLPCPPVLRLCSSYSISLRETCRRQTVLVGFQQSLYLNNIFGKQWSWWEWCQAAADEFRGKISKCGNATEGVCVTKAFVNQRQSMSITRLKNCNSLIVIQSVYSYSQNIWLLLSLLSGFLGKVAAGQASASVMVKVWVFFFFFY